jgi:uncharacterized protein
VLDLRALRLEPGTVRRERVELHLDPFLLGGQSYTVEPADLEVQVEIQPSTQGLYLKLAFHAAVTGPCMRCLEPARVEVDVAAREYHEPAAAREGDEELTSEYLAGEELDVERWARDAIALELPEKILCSPDCAGICPHCGARLEAGVEHACAEEQPDSRWEKLRELL